MNSVYYPEVWNIWIDCIFTHRMFGTWFSSTLWECILTKGVCVGGRVCVAQLCPSLCHPMDWGPPGSSIHGIFQARILEWVAIPFSRTKGLLSFFFLAPPQGIWNFWDQGLNHYPLQWKCSLNHWTSRDVQGLLSVKNQMGPDGKMNMTRFLH